jgi:NAD(P)-dependent dehydrogenase (short-subunit alcohol dehydrogenase family)
VMISSINSKVGTAHTTLYSGTKGAIEAMTRVWARELAEYATVNAINPGPVMADMYMSAPDEVKQGLALWNPLIPLVAVRDHDSEEAKELGKTFGRLPRIPRYIPQNPQTFQSCNVRLGTAGALNGEPTWV